jgi:hypothetical protein
MTEDEPILRHVICENLRFYPQLSENGFAHWLFVDPLTVQ